MFSPLSSHLNASPLGLSSHDRLHPYPPAALTACCSGLSTSLGEIPLSKTFVYVPLYIVYVYHLTHIVNAHFKALRNEKLKHCQFWHFLPSPQKIILRAPGAQSPLPCTMLAPGSGHSTQSLRLRLPGFLVRFVMCPYFIFKIHCMLLIGMNSVSTG